MPTRRPVGALRESRPVGRALARPASAWFVQRRARIRIGNPARHRVLVPGSETCRGVPQAGQPGLGVVAFGDDSGDAPADAGQWAPYALPHVVVHRSSSFSGQLFAGHYLSFAVRPSWGHRRKSLFCLLRYVLAGPEAGLPGLSAPRPRPGSQRPRPRHRHPAAVHHRRVLQLCRPADYADLGAYRLVSGGVRPGIAGITQSACRILVFPIIGRRRDG